MNSQRSYDVGGLRQSGTDMGKVGQQIRRDWEAMAAEADLDGIFGTNEADDVGQLIRMAYEVVHGMAAETFLAGAADLANFEDGLVQTSDGHRANEVTGETTATQLGQRLGPTDPVSV